MLIRMLQTRIGTKDGFSIKLYFEDIEYEVADGMGSFFCRNGWAEKIACDIPTDRMGKAINRILTTRKA